MIPDFNLYNPDPAYLRGLIQKTGLSQRAVARTIGVSERMFRQYITSTENKTYSPAPYAVQFALEVWAKSERP